MTKSQNYDLKVKIMTKSRDDILSWNFALESQNFYT